MQYPWYHGDISREEAESILTTKANRFPRGSVIFLVRKSNSSPKDFVVTWMKVGDSIGNYMVKVMGAGSNVTYIMDVTCPGKKTKYFNELDALLNHFKEPDCGLPNGALTDHVPCAVMRPLPIPEALPLPPPEEGEGPELGPIPESMLIPRSMKPQELTEDEENSAPPPVPPPPRKNTAAAMQRPLSPEEAGMIQPPPPRGAPPAVSTAPPKKKGGCVIA